MNELSINDRRYNGAGTWEEMNPREAEVAMEALNTFVNEENFDYELLRVKQQLIKKLYKITDWDFVGWKWSYFFKRNKRQPNDFLIGQWKDEVLSLVDFVFEKSTFTKNLLPSFWYKGVKYYGPSDNIMNVTGDEMEKAMVCIIAYTTIQEPEQKDEWLRKFVATIYRPVSFLSVFRYLLSFALRQFLPDLRKRFNEDHIEKRAIQLKGMKLAQMTLVERWFLNCMASYKELYPDVFEEADSAVEVDVMHFRKLLRSLAGEKRGTVEHVKKMLADEIYFELNCLEIERKEIERIMRKK